MGDWMGSCVNVKLADGMGHFGQIPKCPITSVNLTSRSLFFNLEHMLKKVYRITF